MTGRIDRLFVRRDEAGKIVEVSLQPAADFEPCLAFSETRDGSDDNKLAEQLNLLAATDLSLIRVLEDLIDLLIAKEMICFTDLPETAQQKLLDRRSLRSKIRGLDLLGDEYDEII